MNTSNGLLNEFLRLDGVDLARFWVEHRARLAEDARMVVSRADELDDQHLSFALEIVKDSGVGLDLAVKHVGSAVTYVRVVAIECLVEHGVQDASWLGPIREARASVRFGTDDLDQLLWGS